MAETEARFPPKLEFLFQPSRYKVAYGGRGGTKSWGYARALLIQASGERHRVLCAREIQRSIRDSVHKLLCDQIEALGLSWFYEITQTSIRGRNGSEFIFSGLADQTAGSIKSFEGVTRCWVEEAQNVSKRSWGILIPTIRAPGSEIWVSFNPELDTDDTYQRFVLNPPPDTVVAKLTYLDNPWFPPELEKERLTCQQNYPQDYRNIWEGECRAAVEGAIYAEEVSAIHDTGRLCNVPYDPQLKVHVVCDLGFNDQMSLILVQRNMAELRVFDYLEDSHRTLDYYSSVLKDRRLNWGKLWLPHDAKHKTLAAGGKSTADIMRGLGWDLGEVRDVGVELGIKKARMALARTWFDKTKCVRLMECLKRYRRSIPQTTGEPGAPMHDEFSHGADAYRYLAVVADELKNENRWGEKLAYQTTGIR